MIVDEDNSLNENDGNDQENQIKKYLESYNHKRASETLSFSNYILIICGNKDQIIITKMLSCLIEYFLSIYNLRFNSLFLISLKKLKFDLGDDSKKIFLKSPAMIKKVCDQEIFATDISFLMDKDSKKNIKTEDWINHLNTNNENISIVDTVCHCEEGYSQMEDLNQLYHYLLKSSYESKSQELNQMKCPSNDQIVLNTQFDLILIYHQNKERLSIFHQSYKLQVQIINQRFPI